MALIFGPDIRASPGSNAAPPAHAATGGLLPQLQCRGGSGVDDVPTSDCYPDARLEPAREYRPYHIRRLSNARAHHVADRRCRCLRASRRCSPLAASATSCLSSPSSTTTRARHRRTVYLTVATSNIAKRSSWSLSCIAYGTATATLVSRNMGAGPTTWRSGSPTLRRGRRRPVPARRPVPDAVGGTDPVFLEP